MPAVTLDDIRRAVTANAFAAGRDYEAGGRVSDLRVEAEGHVIETMVQGSARRPYRVRVARGVRTSDGGAIVAGSCSCPVGHNCKHVVAALFATMRRKDALPPVIPSNGQSLDETASEPPLPSAVTIWLRDLERAREQETEDYPSGVRKRLLYVASASYPSGGTARLDVQLVDVEVRRGEFASGTAKHHAVHQFSYGQPPRFLRPSDRTIIRLLGSVGYNLASGGATSVALLRDIIATGRGRWNRVDGPMLRLGEPRPGQLAWQVGSDGAQRLILEAEGDLLAVFAGDAWYAEPATGIMGPLDLGLPSGLLRAVLASPPVPPEVAQQVGAEMSRRLPDIPLPLSHPQAPPRRIAGPPVPCLELFGAAARKATPLARLVFRYGPIPVPAFPRGSELRSRHEEQRYVATRDQRAEAQAQGRLAELGLLPLGSVSGGTSDHQHCLAMDDPASWIDFMLDDVPALRRDGWQVDVAKSFPLRLAEMQGEITAEIHELSGMDWFDFALGVMVDGERVDLIPALLAVIEEEPALADWMAEEDAPLLLPLADGRLLPIPRARIQPILKPLLELFTGRISNEGIRLSRGDAADLALLEAEGTGVAWAGGEALRLLGRQLREAGGIPHATVPGSFAARLRPYQARGVDWLQFLRTAGLGGVLADDMGLGKTVQALAHLAIEQAEGRLDRPALVVCPTSLVANWRAEAARFAPSLRILTLHGPDRAARFPEIGAHDLVLTTYPLLARDHAALAEPDWHAVILDEVQVIKNPAATTSKLARTLRARQRLCLSGTPLENHLGELWSLFDFLMPGFLGDRRSKAALMA